MHRPLLVTKGAAQFLGRRRIKIPTGAVENDQIWEDSGPSSMFSGGGKDEKERETFKECRI